jgi:signal transduction histidine kinase/CheY-like chemotaxis protein
MLSRFFLLLVTSFMFQVGFAQQDSTAIKISGDNVVASENILTQNQARQKEFVKSENDRFIFQNKVINGLYVITSGTLMVLLYLLYRSNDKRKKANEDLKKANLELIDAKEKAEAGSLLKTQFVSTISHELRTPLYGIVGITNIILEEHRELVDSPHLNSLKFSARYLLSLVNDLLQINKIEENKITLENMIFNIGDEMNSITDSLNFIALKNNNKLVTEIDSTIPDALIGDKLRLSQVFMNLVSNALKFTKDGEVKLIAKLEKVSNLKHYIRFKVQDNGVGIAKENQDKIFDKFVQLERKEGDYQGTGLGLSIVQKLIELFGSKIELESEEGVGTTFSFTICFESDEKKKTEIINNIEVDLSTGNSLKILVVEDNKINQIVTRKVLVSNNFICTLVDDGYGAIELLDQEKFDLILMDINMPVINGFDTTVLIRKKGIKIPIIALTAFDKEDILDESLSAGMNDIIIKPFEPSVLFQAISNCMEKSRMN